MSSPTTSTSTRKPTGCGYAVAALLIVAGAAGAYTVAVGLGHRLGGLAVFVTFLVMAVLSLRAKPDPRRGDGAWPEDGVTYTPRGVVPKFLQEGPYFRGGGATGEW